MALKEIKEVLRRIFTPATNHPELDALTELVEDRIRFLAHDLIDIDAGNDTAPTATCLFSFQQITEGEQSTAGGSATGAGTPGSTFTIGPRTYTIVANGTADPAKDEINAGTNAATFAAAIAAKVTADTDANHCSGAAVVADLTFLVNDTGAAGDTMPLDTNDPGLTLDAGFLGGVDYAAVPKTCTLTTLAGAVDGILNP